MANPEHVLEMRNIAKVFPGVRALDGVKKSTNVLKEAMPCDYE